MLSATGTMFRCASRSGQSVLRVIVRSLSATMQDAPTGCNVSGARHGATFLALAFLMLALQIWLMFRLCVFCASYIRYMIFVDVEKD